MCPKKLSSYLFWALICLTLLSTVTVIAVSAKFAAENKTNVDARVARIALETSDVRIISLGDTVEYRFKVTDKDAIGVSEVSFSYNVTVSMPNDDLVSIKFYCNEVESEPLRTISDNMIVYTFSEVGYFEANVQAIHECNLRLSIPKEALSSFDGKTIEGIRVEVTAVQIN